MRIHLVNPSDLSFGTAVITPRWLYVLAAATPERFGPPQIIDETLDPLDLDSVQAGDVVGIGIHTANALRGYKLGRDVRERAAPMSSSAGFTRRSSLTKCASTARRTPSSAATAIWCGPRCWPTARPAHRSPATTADASKATRSRRRAGICCPPIATCGARCRRCAAARSTARSARCGGPTARSRGSAGSHDVVREIVALRRKGFRFVLLADDNFYPVTLADLAQADRRADKRQLENLKALREERFELMAALEQLPTDMVFYTQITMEAAEDPEFLDAMKRAHIHGALVGIESVTPEGLKAVFKDFNQAGEGLVTRLQKFREHGVHVLGSFIFGLPTDTPDTFDATADLAQRAGVSFAQFVMLTPFPGTVDFAKWEKEAVDVPTVNGVPLTRYWLIPPSQRPKVYAPHPRMSADEIRARTQGVWDTFYEFGAIWQRSNCVKSVRSRLAFVLLSKLYRQMYANTGIATDSARVTRSVKRARVIARAARRLFIAEPMPDLAEPPVLATPPRMRAIPARVTT